MGINDVLTLVGGLALFLLGMNSMGDGLEKACGNKMKKILEKLTSNRIVGVLVGMVITMVIQSSSATTVMVVGFVNAGMMSLTQAVWIIMGANIGTTITGQLVALDVGGIAPVFAIVGVVMLLFIKKPRVNEIGKIFLGFGILFIGMDLMSQSMMPLRESDAFIGLMTKFSNPILGILAGMIFTAIIQSSSASVGILQALAISGVVTLDTSVYILFGQNIGTCITAVIASLSANRAAKRTTIIHLMFNIIGTIIFTIICYFTPFTGFVKGLSTSPASQIANMHTIFNIVSTLVLLPFGGYLVKFAQWVLPDKETKRDSIFEYLDNDINMNVGDSAVRLENIRLEINRMYELGCKNVINSFNYLMNNDSSYSIINETEELIDQLDDGIAKKITSYICSEINDNVSQSYSSYLTISNNIERLSDHAINICEHKDEFDKLGINASDALNEDFLDMKNIINEMFALALSGKFFNNVSKIEENIDNMTKKFRDNIVSRLKANQCSSDGAIIYSSILIDFERLGDHLMNIAENIKRIENTNK